MTNISTIIPLKDKDGNIKLPLSWKMGEHKISCCITLTPDEARQLADNLTKESL